MSGPGAPQARSEALPVTPGLEFGPGRWHAPREIEGFWVSLRRLPRPFVPSTRFLPAEDLTGCTVQLRFSGGTIDCEVRSVSGGRLMLSDCSCVFIRDVAGGTVLTAPVPAAPQARCEDLPYRTPDGELDGAVAGSHPSEVASAVRRLWPPEEQARLSGLLSPEPGCAGQAQYEVTFRARGPWDGRTRFEVQVTIPGASPSQCEAQWLGVRPLLSQIAGVELVTDLSDARRLGERC